MSVAAEHPGEASLGETFLAEAADRLQLAEAARQAARTWAPRKPQLARVPAAPGAIPVPTSDQLTVALQVIHDTGLKELLEGLLPPPDRRPTGGAPRIMTVTALLTSLLLLAMLEQPLLLRDAARLLDRLAPTSRRMLGLPGRRAITERMVSRMWNDIAEQLDPSPHAERNMHLFDPGFWRAHGLIDPEEQQPATAVAASSGSSITDPLVAADVAIAADAVLAQRAERLREVIARCLQATLQRAQVPEHTGSYAIDASLMASWARQRSRTARKSIPAHRRTDPDAGWRAIKGRDAIWGYAIHALVRVPEKAPPGQRPAVEIPALIEAFDVTSARAYNTTAGMALLERTIARNEQHDQQAGRAHRPRRDLLADREYGRDARWQAHAFACGFDTVFDLAAEQRGLTSIASNGALIIDGLPYSPGTPMRLRTLPRLGPFATIAQRASVAEAASERERYRLRAQGPRRDDGSLDLACPASTLVRAVRCDNKPASLQLPITRPAIGTALPVITQPGKPTACAQAKTRIGFDELPFWQQDAWMTPQWQASYGRRNLVEGAFGNLKNDPAQDITRGRIHVMGRAKTTLMLAFAAMAHNLRIAAISATTPPPSAPPKARTPRLRSRRMQHARLRITARRLQQATTSPPDQAPDPPPDEPGTDRGTVGDNPFIP